MACADSVRLRPTSAPATSTGGLPFSLVTFGAPGAPPLAQTKFDLLTILQPIRFESSKRQSAGFRQIEDDPSLAFTFGLEDPEDLQDDAQNIAVTDRLALRSGLAPLPNMLIQGGYEHNENQRIFFGGSNDEDQTIRQYDKVLFDPREAIPVELEHDNRLFVVHLDRVLAIFRRSAQPGSAKPNEA